MTLDFSTIDASRVMPKLQRVSLRYPWVSLLPILGIYFLLALFRIGNQSLWHDEILSLRNARVDEPLFSSSIWREYHGPLYFVLLHVWAKLGTSEVILRTLSVLIGAAALCLTYATALELFNRRVAVIVSILLATSPFFIWYSQEVRYITLMMCAALLSMWAFWQALCCRRPFWWLIYAGALVVAVFSFITCVFLIPAQGVFLLLSGSYRPLLRRWILLQAPVIVLLLWWAYHTHYTQVIIEESDEGEQSVSIDLNRLRSGGRKELTPAVLPYTFFAFSAGFSVGPSLRDLHVSRALASLLPYSIELAVVGTLFGGLFILGVKSLRSLSQVGRFLALWLVAPILGGLMLALLTGVTYNVRYVATAFPAFCLILAPGIAQFRKPAIQVVLLTAVLCANTYSLANYYFNPKYAREDARSTAAYLQAAAGAKDAVLIVGSPNDVRYYYKGNLSLLSATRETINEPSAAGELLDDLQQKHERLWLVCIRPWQTDPTGKLKALLDRSYPVIDQKEFAGVNIYCYRLVDEKLTG